MWRQAFRPTAAILSALMLCSVPALAGTVRFADMTSGGPARTAGDVRLRVAAAAGQDHATQQGPAAAQTSGQQPAGSETSAGGRTTTPGSADGTLTQSGAGQIETVDLGDVTGTVCDCGVIPDTIIPRAGGFPWWPLLGGAIVPFLFRKSNEPPDTPENPQPTPTEPPPSIPEPATLLLFGTGLLAVGARARRRFSGKQAPAQGGPAEEV